MKKKLLITVGTVAVGVVTLGVSLPKIVHALGLHPTYEGETYDLKGKRALVVTTSHGVLNAPGETVVIEAAPTRAPPPGAAMRRQRRAAVSAPPTAGGHTACTGRDGRAALPR